MAFEKFTNTPDTTANYSLEDVESNKVMAVLAYISWLVLIPLFAAKNSPYARYHTNQGLVLFLLSLVWTVASNIVTSILGLIPIVGAILNFIIGVAGFIVGLFMLACMILGIINAATGKAKELPIIGGIKILK